MTNNHRDVWKLLGSLQLQLGETGKKRTSQRDERVRYHVSKVPQLCVGQMFVRDDRNLKTLLRELMDPRLLPHVTERRKYRVRISSTSWINISVK